VEDIPFFREQGLEVAGAVNFFDREQGGVKRIKSLTGVEVYSCLGISKALEMLVKNGKLTQELMDTTMTYLNNNRFDTPEYGVKD